MRRQPLRRAVVAALALALAGCTTVLVRTPAPGDAFEEARPYGIDAPLIRAWGDETGVVAADEIVRNRADAIRRANAARIAAGQPIPSTMLALSGGGPDGAFGAGLLAGWTARGDRPTFQIVSGVSTGAIIGLFAFLGPDHDATLREIYTGFATRDLLTPALFTGLLGGAAVTDTSGFRRLIARYVDQDVVAALAAAHQEGRVLLIGTTNLDATRPVIWNVGAIAASGHPAAAQLIRDVIEASAAIPGAFQPVLIPVEADGRVFDEMYVDGGATRQVLLFSPAFQVRRIDEAVGVPLDRELYVIVNNRLRRPHRPVAPRLRPIMSTAISSLIASAGAGDVLQLYAAARRENIPMRLISIPAEFESEAEEPFDREHMRALYDFGFAMGRQGAPWRSAPPGFEAAPDGP